MNGLTIFSSISCSDLEFFSSSLRVAISSIRFNTACFISAAFDLLNSLVIGTRFLPPCTESVVIINSNSTVKFIFARFIGSLKKGEGKERGEVYMVALAGNFLQLYQNPSIVTHHSTPLHFSQPSIMQFHIYFLLLSSLSLLSLVVSSHPSRENDGTLAYFNNVYRSQMENPEDGQIYYLSYPNLPKHRAKIGENGEWSQPHSSKYLAERAAINTYLLRIGGFSEIERAKGYKDRFTLLLSDALIKEREKSVEIVYQFGEILSLEENQYLELKSNRIVPQTKPITTPFSHDRLRHSIKEHLTKYAVAFLNSHCLSPFASIDSSYTIKFGIHDNGVVDGYYTTDGEKDATTQMINTRLDRLTKQTFDRKIQWNLVETSDGQQAYIVSVTLTPHIKQMYAVEYNGDFIFWVRKDNKTQKMSFAEIEIGFGNS